MTNAVGRKNSVNGPRDELLDEVLAAAGLYRRLPDGKRRARIREDAGVSQRQMAEALGVSTMTLWRWERQGVRPRLDHARAYLALLEELERVL
jgi:DNA-binding transcriptional regulator YiaG